MHQPLSCADSTPAPEALSAELERHYDLGETIACELLQRNLDAVYLWETRSGRYVIRVYNARWWTEAEVEAELTLLAHLARRGLSVSAPISRRDARLRSALQAPEGTRSVAVLHFLSGQPMDPKRDARDYGELVARVHSELADVEPAHVRRRLDLEGLMSDSFEPVLGQLAPTSVLHGYFVGLRQRVRARAEQWGLASFEQCICHGDLNFANCLRLDDGRIGLFDFECCGPGLRVYDLAVFRWTQLTVGVHDDTWNDFLTGYRAGGAIKERELAAMDLLVLLRQAWLIGHDARRTEIQSLGTRWRRVGTRNLDVLRRFDSELFGT